MLPFLNFRWPGITGHSKGADDQRLGHQQIIQHQVPDGGQGDDSLTKA